MALSAAASRRHYMMYKKITEGYAFYGTALIFDNFIPYNYSFFLVTRYATGDAM